MCPTLSHATLQAYVLQLWQWLLQLQWKLSWDTEVAQTRSRQSRTGTAITGAYIGSTSEALPISVCGQTTTACTPTKLSACINTSCPSATLRVKTNSREQNWHRAFFSKHNKKLIIKYKKSGKLNNELLKKNSGSVKKWKRKSKISQDNCKWTHNFPKSTQCNKSSSKNENKIEAFLKKQEKFWINNLTYHLIEL